MSEVDQGEYIKVKGFSFGKRELTVGEVAMRQFLAVGTEHRMKMENEILRITNDGFDNIPFSPKKIGEVRACTSNAVRRAYEVATKAAFDFLLSMSVEEIEQRTGVKLRSDSRDFRVGDEVSAIDSDKDGLKWAKGDIGTVIESRSHGRLLVVKFRENTATVPADWLYKR